MTTHLCDFEKPLEWRKAVCWEGQQLSGRFDGAELLECNKQDSGRNTSSMAGGRADGWPMREDRVSVESRAARARAPNVGGRDSGETGSSNSQLSRQYVLGIVRLPAEYLCFALPKGTKVRQTRR